MSNITPQVETSDVCPITLNIDDNLSNWVTDYLRTQPFEYIITGDYAVYLWNATRKEKDPAIDLFVKEISQEQLYDLFEYLERRRICHCREYGGRTCEYEFLLYKDSYMTDSTKPIYTLNVRYGRQVKKVVRIIVNTSSWETRRKEIDGLSVIDLPYFREFIIDKRLLKQVQYLQRHRNKCSQAYDVNRKLMCCSEFCLK